MKHLVRKSKSLLIAFKIYQNWRMKRRFASGEIETEHGSTHSKKNLDESLSYIDEQFADYLTYGQLTSAQLRGKKILELGFGDNVGVALRFLATGAARVVCVDKFYSRRDVAHERDIYTALRAGLSDDEKQRFDEAIDIADGLTFNSGRLSCVNGLELEAAAARLSEQAESFDIIVSRAVIEEIYEPDKVFSAADRLLVPGGLMLHKIDLSDYGIFSDRGKHPLTFLTFSESVYRLMATDSGIPNRKLSGYYQKQMAELGYDAKFFVTEVVGHGPIVPHQEPAQLNGAYSARALPLINAIRPKLSREFRELPDEELMVAGVFLVARKPIAARGPAA